MTEKQANPEKINCKSRIVLGAIIGYATSFGLWYAQTNHSFEEGVKKSREDLIVEVADVLSHAPRINRIIEIDLMQVAPGKPIRRICLAAELRGEKLDSCQDGADYSFIKKFDKDIYIYTAKYQKLKSLSFIYFCGKTNAKFQDFDSKIPWWEISQTETKELLTAMHSEYTCNL